MVAPKDDAKSTTIVLSDWFLQILTGLITVSIIGVASWAGWVTFTLDATNKAVQRYSFLERRVETVEGVTRQHSRAIRDLKKVKVVR